MYFNEKGYFSKKALFYSLDLLYEDVSKIRNTLKNTYIVVDFDKTLIIKDALFKLIFICFLSNGFKYLFLVLNELFKTLGQIHKIDELKNWVKNQFSTGIVKIMISWFKRNFLKHIL